VLLIANAFSSRTGKRIEWAKATVVSSSPFPPPPHYARFFPVPVTFLYRASDFFGWISKLIPPFLSFLYGGQGCPSLYRVSSSLLQLFRKKDHHSQITESAPSSPLNFDYLDLVHFLIYPPDGISLSQLSLNTLSPTFSCGRWLTRASCSVCTYESVV